MNNTLDIGDMQQYNFVSDEGHNGSTREGLFAHEIVEEYDFQKTPGTEKVSNDNQKSLFYPQSHNAAIDVENKINGNERIHGGARIEGREWEQAPYYYRTYKQKDGSLLQERTTEYTNDMQIQKKIITKP